MLFLEAGQVDVHGFVNHRFCEPQGPHSPCVWEGNEDCASVGRFTVALVVSWIGYLKDEQVFHPFAHHLRQGRNAGDQLLGGGYQMILTDRPRPRCQTSGRKLESHVRV